MYKLYFIDAKHDKHFVAESASLIELNQLRQADSKERGFKPEYYTRSWIADGGQWIDFGSWSCYYFIEGVTMEDLCR